MTNLPDPSPESKKATKQVFDWLEDHFRSTDIMLNAPNAKQEILDIIDAEFADLRARLAMREEQLEALTLNGWEIEEHGVGPNGLHNWAWRCPPDIAVYCGSVMLGQLPPWPDEAHKALAEQRSKQ
jgi:hypothetical protein